MEVLLVKSGNVDNPVTKILEMEPKQVKSQIGNRTLRYIGLELEPIGEATRMSAYAGPDHVVLNVKANNKDELGLQKAGFYLVADVNPSDLKM